jgi:drug/metabolite transporter (DMT)-like permease
MIAGIVLALAAAVANAFAVVLQASESRQAPLSQAGRFELLFGLARRRRWLAGTGLMVLAWPLQILALTYAPITVVQPTLASGALILLVVARVKLGERVGRPEALGAVAIVVGIGVVIGAAPPRSTDQPGALRLAAPLLVVGAGAVGAFVLGRRRPRRALAMVIGAGLGYAWVDFANKLLSNAISTDRWPQVALWLVATLALGALAFLEENTALQQRPAVTVAPVIGAVQGPLPVVMALWAGVESWGAGTKHLAELALGLAIVTLGAATLGRSQAVARVSGDEWPARRTPESGARSARPGVSGDAAW